MSSKRAVRRQTVLRFSGERMRDAREGRGLTQAELTQRVAALEERPLQQSAFSLYERGRAVPSADRLFAIAAALRVKPRDLGEEVTLP